MKHICPKCHYVGEAKYKALNNYSIPFGGIFLGLGIYSLSIIKFPQILKPGYFLFLVLISVPLFLIGAFLIYNYREKNSDLCPKCSYGHMHPINSKQANKLIEDNNINT